MANYITCAKQGFSFDSILMSMFSYVEHEDDGILGFRVSPQTGAFEYLPECDRYESWKDLFREALELGDDGYAYLRIVSATTDAIAPTCTNWQTVDQLMRQSFVRMTESGDVALVLIMA